MLKGKSHLKPKEIVRDRRVASKRIHVEPEMGLAKKINILRYEFPNSKSSCFCFLFLDKECYCTQICLMNCLTLHTINKHMYVLCIFQVLFNHNEMIYVV